MAQQCRYKTRHPMPFPWSCSTCGKQEVRPATIQHTAIVKRGQLKYKVYVPDLPVLCCGSCGAVLMENDSHDKILSVLRQQLKLVRATRKK